MEIMVHLKNEVVCYMEITVHLKNEVVCCMEIMVMCVFAFLQF